MIEVRHMTSGDTATYEAPRANPRPDQMPDPRPDLKPDPRPDPRVEVRPITPDDAHTWRELWDAYLRFNGHVVSEEVYQTTLERFFRDDVFEPNALIAWAGDKGVGLAHYLQHRHCWEIENVLYLQHLYVCAEARGLGVGPSLLKAIYAVADRENLGSVYWMTAQDNMTARKLYDEFGKVTPYIKYQR
ncbi:MAG: GNAT family N-acetyltransferase [Pseudomonadota bacterium]